MMKLRFYKVDYFSCLGLLFLFIDAITVITHQILDLSIIFLSAPRPCVFVKKFTRGST